jgi:hypothetical protein
VAEPFLNEWPIVTHWDQSINDGRGGQRVGGTDGLNEIGASGGVFYRKRNVGTDGQPLDPKWVDHDPNDVFNTTDYGLLLDDPDHPNATYPGFERYIGENYDLDRLTSDAAKLISDHARILTGYPAMHLNYEENLGSPDFSAVQENVPVFQIIHNVIVTPNIPGASQAENEGKEGLVTVVLPPFWNKNQAARYPVYFAPLYNSTYTLVIAAPGALPIDQFFQIFGQSYDFEDPAGGGAIMVTYNGGATENAATSQPSAQHQAGELFENLLPTHFKADPHRIVAHGCSRGGFSSLYLSTPAEDANGDPIYDYTFAYILTNSGTLTAPDYGPATLTFGGSYFQGSGMLGYTDGWKQGWTKPVGPEHPEYVGPGDPGYPVEKNIGELLLWQATGVTDWADFVHLADDAPGRFLDDLKRQGSIVVYGYTTADLYFPTSRALRFHRRVDAKGTPIRTELNYRGGHCPPSTSLYEHPKAAIRDLLDATTQPSINVFGRQSSPTGAGFYQFRNPHDWDPVDDWIEWEYFAPDRTPMHLEMPMKAWQGDYFNMAVFGESGWEFDLQLIPVPGRCTDCVDIPIANLVLGTDTDPDDMLTAGENTIAWVDGPFYFGDPSTMLPGEYSYQLKYREPGGQWQTMPADVQTPGAHTGTFLPQPQSDPYDPLSDQCLVGGMSLFATEPDKTRTEMLLLVVSYPASGLSSHHSAQAWGLSDDQLVSRFSCDSDGVCDFGEYEENCFDDCQCEKNFGEPTGPDCSLGWICAANRCVQQQ